MHTLIVSVVPVFVIVGLGYIARRFEIVKPAWVTALIGYVYHIALPAMIISSIVTLTVKGSNVPSVLFWNVVLLVANTLLCLAFVTLLRIPKKDRAVFFLAATVGNSMYLGIPLTTSALKLTAGSQDHALIVLIGVVQLVGGIFIALLVNEFLFVGNKNMRSMCVRLAKNPLIIAIAIGLLLSALPIPSLLNDALKPTLTMLAASASPVALFVLGNYLYGHALRGKKFELVAAVAWKIAIVPLLAWGLMRAAGLQHPSYAAIILYAGMPTAVTALMIAKAYGFNTSFIAAVILISTVVSLVSESALILLLGL